MQMQIYALVQMLSYFGKCASAVKTDLHTRVNVYVPNVNEVGQITI